MAKSAFQTPSSKDVDDNSERVPSLPIGFEGSLVETGDSALFVQIGGQGDAVVLLHGYAQSGDMWGPLAAELMTRYTVIVPDLRGLGRSTRPPGGYEKRAQARDLRGIIQNLGFDRVSLVGHDLGGMVAYAYAAQYREQVRQLVVMEAAPPGIPPWQQIASMPGVWHFHFRGPEAEQLVKGRERVYFDRFWNSFARDPSQVNDAVRDHYAEQYAAPGAMRSGFAQFAAFDQDVRDNDEFAKIPITIPVLAIGGECEDRAFSRVTASAMREVATDVRESIIPHAGHWLMEENPRAVVDVVRGFLQ
jgi:pimeloyl-ACP methyl ester carboxylesterase